MMKKILIVLLPLLMGGVRGGLLFSQTKNEIRAAEDYSAYNYTGAINRYEKTAKSDAMLRSLADSYFKTREYVNAEKTYAQLATSPGANPQDIVHYISVLLANEKYNDAMSWMEKYSAANFTDKRYAKYLSQKNLVDKLKTNAGQFTIKNLDINSEQEDFGAVFYKNAVVYTSSREGTKQIARIWNGNKLPYLDLYLAQRSSTGELVNVVPFEKSFNKKYHEGPCSFTKNGEVLAFTRNDYAATSADGTRKLQIFISQYSSDSSGFKVAKWSAPKGVPFNSADYSVGHPALNSDGTVLYFSSDKPGGYGGVDLYKVNRNPDGTWGRPENLGNKINTPGDEMFPYLHPSGLLFFASNGHEGLGGLDVFVAEMENGEFGRVKNVGAPINSSKDDFSFALDAAMESGYFASNRGGGGGDDDLYSFKMLKPFHFGKIIKGVTKGKDGEKLEHTDIKIMDDSNRVVKIITSDVDGNYSFDADEGKTYNLSASRKKYFDGKNSADTKTDKDEIVADLILEKAPPFSIYFLLKDKATNKPLDSVKVVVIDNMKGKDLTSFITPATGDNRIAVTDKNVGERYSYQIKMEKNGYLGKVLTLNDSVQPGEIRAEITMDKIEVGTDIGKIIDIKPIYFDVKKFDIRPDAATELDKIVKVLNDNPNMVIELGSHTDCRGDAASNLKLSDKRAKSSAEYIKKKISNPDRISGKGYGETQLINNCACEGKTKSDCSEDDHAKNRRTEFKIVKM